MLGGNKMSNLWKRLNKQNKSNYEISKETNIPEEKVKEIMEGERELPTEKVDEFTKALQEERIKRDIKMHEVYEWYKSVNIRQLREEFGYETQLELASQLGLASSTISNIECGNKEYGYTTILKLYDFFTNKLNKKIDKKLKEEPEEPNDIKKIKDWYIKTDLVKARERLGYKSQASLARAIKLSPSTISRIESKLDKNSKYFNESTLMIYYNFLNNNSNKNKAPKKVIRKYKNMSEEERQTDFEEVKKWYKGFNVKQWLYDKHWYHTDLAKALGYKSSSTITDVLNGRRTIEQSKNVLTKLYLYIKEENNIVEAEQKVINELSIEPKDNFYKYYDEDEEDIEVLDEEITIDDKVEHIINNIDEEYKKEYEEPVKTSNDIKVLEELNEDKKGTIMRLEYELEEARKQIARYEKLIDMIER